MLGVFFIVAVLNAVFWYGDGRNLYQSVATLPIMATLAVTVGVALLVKKRVAAGLLFLAQALVFALPYLTNIGSSLDFAESALLYDNVLTFGSWLLLGLLLTAWRSPRRQTHPEPAPTL